MIFFSKTVDFLFSQVCCTSDQSMDEFSISENSSNCSNNSTFLSFIAVVFVVVYYSIPVVSVVVVTAVVINSFQCFFFSFSLLTGASLRHSRSLSMFPSMTRCQLLSYLLRTFKNPGPSLHSQPISGHRPLQPEVREYRQQQGQQQLLPLALLQQQQQQ